MGGMLLAMVASCVGSSWAATYTVTSANGSGAGSLRWAIGQANTHAGADTIEFAPGLSGASVPVLTTLPTLTDAETTIEGDLNGDGIPNIGLRGRGAGGTVEGLVVTGYGCVISGLATYDYGNVSHVRIQDASSCTVRRCWFGLSPTAGRYDQTASAYLNVVGGAHHVIGGSSWLDRNVLHTVPCGMEIRDSSSNTVIGNYFGVTPDGSGRLKNNGQTGLSLASTSPLGGATDNTIGGPGGAANYFAGTVRGISLLQDGTDRNRIIGNYFGLAADGETSLTLGAGIELGFSAADNVIGDTTARNVFAGGGNGVYIAGPGAGNRIQCNYFGTNAAGTSQRPLIKGVSVWGGGEPLTIGGATAALGNHFCGKGGQLAVGVWLGGAAGSSIVHNEFGLLPSGLAVPRALEAGVRLDGVAAAVTNNKIRTCMSGIECTGAGAEGTVRGNNIGNAMGAVLIHNGANCFLGDFAVGKPGNNNLRPSNGYYVYNDTPNDIKAEGNSFGTTSESEILAKMWDEHVNPSLGKVDFDPLKGGISPTGVAGVLTVASATAAPTHAGAEVVFVLSSPAAVTVEAVNAAGRPVARLSLGQLPAGPHRLAWNGPSTTGTRLPAGRYFLRILARDQGGAQAQALCSVLLR